MKKFPRLFGLLLAVSFLAACSATGPKFSAAAQPIKNEALIYVYRPNALFYGAIQSHFYLDDNKVASLNKEGYTAFYVPSGAHIFKQHWTGMEYAHQTIKFPVELAPGETYYYRLTIGFEGFNSAPAYRGVSATHKWVISRVPESEALSEIELTNYQPPFDVTGARKVGQ
jgi:hypothetical protein